MTTSIRTYPTREAEMANILCAHCKQYHSFVWEVRVCAANQEAAKVFKPFTPQFDSPAYYDPAQQHRLERGVQKMAQTSTSVPAGHYALHRNGEWKFYRVARPMEGRWAGRVFVDRQAGDDYYPVQGREMRNHILESISTDVQGAMLAYGQQIGRCGHCHRTLTNLDSIERGIGPICASRMGW